MFKIDDADEWLRDAMMGQDEDGKRVSLALLNRSASGWVSASHQTALYWKANGALQE